MSPKTYIAALWLLSSVPIGAAIWLLPPHGRLLLWAAAILLDTSHRVAPIATSWAHPAFRRVMLNQPWKMLGLPLVLLFMTAAIGLMTSLGWTSFVSQRGQQWVITDISNPFPILVWVYTIWNAYHFGMQNFGVLSLLRGQRSEWQRTCDMTWTCGATVGGMLIVPGMIEFNHWITELGLCARVSRYSILLIFTVLAFGATSFWWMVATPSGMIMWVIPWLVSAHLGLGMWHFMQDRWMWKLSDPQVRATIGQALT